MKNKLVEFYNEGLLYRGEVMDKVRCSNNSDIVFDNYLIRVTEIYNFDTWHDSAAQKLVILIFSILRNHL